MCSSRYDIQTIILLLLLKLLDQLRNCLEEIGDEAGVRDLEDGSVRVLKIVQSVEQEVLERKS